VVLVGAVDVLIVEVVDVVVVAYLDVSAMRAVFMVVGFAGPMDVKMLFVDRVRGFRRHF